VPDISFGFFNVSAKQSDLASQSIQPLGREIPYANGLDHHAGGLQLNGQDRFFILRTKASIARRTEQLANQGLAEILELLFEQRAVVMNRRQIHLQPGRVFGTALVIALLDGDPNWELALNQAVQAYHLHDRVEAVILDIIPVSEYVWDVGTALHGEKRTHGAKWHAMESLRRTSRA
jgi:hypothetical protein